MADRTSLSRATESSDAPTPGYLYLDIARAAASSPIACRETAQFLIRRLQNKQNHNIKYKCLKVLQKTAESPLTRGQFKRDICQDPNSISAIKDALQFRGPPDPARGDSIYEKVRTAAKECLDAVYSDSSSGGPVEVSGSSMNAGLAGGIASNYGNSVAARSGGGGFGGPPMGGYSSSAPGGMPGMGAGGVGAMGGRKMEGIGNPMFKDPRLEENQPKGIGRMTIGEVASAVGSTVKGMIKDPLARNVAPSHSMPSVTVNHSNRIGNLPGYGGNNSSSGAGGGASMYGGYGVGGGGGGYNQSQPPGARELAQQTGGAWTMASNRGANAIQNLNGGTAAHAPSGVGGSWASSGSGFAAPSAVGGHVASAVPISGPGAYKSSGTAASDGTYERNLISELCPPGGMRPEPPEDKLLKFAQSVPSLNSDLVCPVLLDALEDGQPWIIKAKTLCVIEKTIQSANESIGEQNPYSDFFHMCSGEIEPLCSHSRPAVREPAKRVMRALGLAVPTSKPTAPTSAPAPPPVEAPAPPPPEPVNLLDFGEEDTFGSTPVVETTQVPNETPPPPPPDVPPPTVPPPTESSGGASLFGGLNVNESTPATTAPSAPAPAPTGSAFGFISAPSTAPETSTAAPVPAPAPAPVPAPAPKPEDELLSLAAPTATYNTSAMNAPPSSTTFDPLLSLGNASSSTAAPPPPPPMASISPTMTNKQMQNLSYQQNMLMMQHQMQQMQMAMAMQQQQQQQAPKPTNVMQSHTSYIPDMNMMQPVGSMMGKGQQFSILESAKKEEDQKSFDFIKDAMKGAK